MKTRILKLGFTIIAGLASFAMVFASVVICGLFLAGYLTHHHWHGFLPHSYLPTVFVVAGLIAIPASIHSYRATRKHYRGMESEIVNDLVA
jgi:MFS family permease